LDSELLQNLTISLLTSNFQIRNKFCRKCFWKGTNSRFSVTHRF